MGSTFLYHFNLHLALMLQNLFQLLHLILMMQINPEITTANPVPKQLVRTTFCVPYKSIPCAAKSSINHNI